MRTVVLINYSQKPPAEIGRVVLTTEGKVELQNVSPGIKAQLEHGIRNWDTNERVMPSAGAPFIDAVLQDFRGGYIRAVEQ